MLVQRRAICSWRRRHDGQLGIRQLVREGMLFLDRLPRPACRPVELRDDGCGFLDANLIDTVFVAVERKQPPVAAHPAAFHCVEDEIRGESIVGMGIGGLRVRHRINLP